MPGLRRRLDTCVAQPWLSPPSFLRRRLVRFGPDPTIGTAHSFASLAPSCAAGYSASVPTRRMELRTASPPSLRLAPQASRLRLRASGVGVRLLGLRVSQRVCVAACGKRERGQASFEGASPPPRRTQTAAIAEHVSASRSSRHLKLQVRSSRNARYTHAPGPRTRAHAHRARADTRVVLIACTSLAHHPTSQGVRG